MLTMVNNKYTRTRKKKKMGKLFRPSIASLPLYSIFISAVSVQMCCHLSAPHHGTGMMIGIHLIDSHTPPAFVCHCLSLICPCILSTGGGRGGEEVGGGQ